MSNILATFLIQLRIRFYASGEAEELRRRDEEEMLKRRDMARRRIENHLNQHGGDLSLLMRDGPPSDMRCVQLTQWGSDDDYVKTARTNLPLPMKNEVLIKSYAW